MQIELLDRQKWKTRVELANAIFDYIEIFHNRQRRHSQLGYRTPIEHELRLLTAIHAARPESLTDPARRSGPAVRMPSWVNLSRSPEPARPRSAAELGNGLGGHR